MSVQSGTLGAGSGASPVKFVVVVPSIAPLPVTTTVPLDTTLPCTRPPLPTATELAAVPGSETLPCTRSSIRTFPDEFTLPRTSPIPWASLTTSLPAATPWPSAMMSFLTTVPMPEMSTYLETWMAPLTSQRSSFMKPFPSRTLPSIVAPFEQMTLPFLIRTSAAMLASDEFRTKLLKSPSIVLAYTAGWVTGASTKTGTLA